MPVIAEVVPALAENVQPVRGHWVPHQRHKLALPTGTEGQTLLEIPVVVPHRPELNCKGKRKEGPQRPQGQTSSHPLEGHQDNLFFFKWLFQLSLSTNEVERLLIQGSVVVSCFYFFRVVLERKKAERLTELKHPIQKYWASATVLIKLRCLLFSLRCFACSYVPGSLVLVRIQLTKDISKQWSFSTFIKRVRPNPEGRGTWGGVAQRAPTFGYKSVSSRDLIYGLGPVAHNTALGTWKLPGELILNVLAIATIKTIIMWREPHCGNVLQYIHVLNHTLYTLNLHNNMY